MNISRKNLPSMLVENHSSRVTAQDRFTNKTLKINRYHPPLSEPHHDLSQLLTQSLREFQLSQTEAYNKWVVTPAIPKSGSKISPPLLRPAPLPPTPVQKRPTTTHQPVSLMSELNAVLAKRNAANTNGLQSKHPLTFTPQQIKDTLVYVKEFNKIF
ncbi:hypothetical protein [Candidatus Symbiopectobacterium sp. 'North America']|uniref:hypothetical protein n=1 Tax=Candidatus Symbiopectobacterium sp. 'North America' TaxID=2794574 RepID=UPI0018C9086B|nr:hypothetical protein [Candidatus Symbiopectobacterium sp. 'North America']